ncbi:cytochrome b/b6 domain-containing protein [Phenylobacterium sp.]|uniref:cytochrome b/b6 domain-containing protein n=1 Tax=Phenylobacterium sp. TaxID=1871053 RepID=UPI0035AFF89D
MTEEPINTTRTIRAWDLPLRLFHWALAISIAVAFLSSEEDSALAAWHMAAGWTAAVLIAFRLVWGFIGGEHARFASFLRPGRIGAHLRELLGGRPAATVGHNPLGALAVVGLLGLTAATVFTGAARGEDLHEALAYALLALVGVHVAAVVVMSLATRENLVRAMVTGSKPAARHPGAQDAKPPRRAALPVAAAVIALAAVAVTRVDPNAFRPGVRDEAAGEHHGGDQARGGAEHEEDEDD